jgi:predicted nuclease with RNAse H fold
MRTLGVDLASAATNTAACVLDWDRSRPRLLSMIGRDVDDTTIVELARGANVTGIDAPFGWPRPFVDAIAAYAAGTRWPRQKPEGLWLRRTDERAIAVAGGRAPLSVSSDRIARPAERAARLLTLLGSDDQAVARDGSDGVIEVYPAGALRCWGIRSDGYKRSDGAGAAARRLIFDTILDELTIETAASDREALVATDHAIDALVASLVARAFEIGAIVRPRDEDRSIAAVEGWLFLPTGRIRDLR